MKTMKKLFSIVMVLALVLSLGVSAFAVDITIGGNGKDNGNKGLDPNSTYTAYKLFDATFERTDEGTGDVYKYTINPKFADAILAGIATGPDEVTSRNLTGGEKKVKKPTDLSDEQVVLEYISGLNADQVRAFADAVFKAIGSLTLSENEDYYTTKADDNGNAKFTNVAGGYYLIAETVVNGTESAVTSLVMLDTAGKGTVTVNTKEDAPESFKKVLDINDTEDLPVTVQPGPTNDVAWEDSADHDMGDTVYFKLEGKLPNDLDHYTNGYKLVFHDKEEQGLTFQSDSVAVYVDDVLITNTEETTYYTVNTNPGDGCTFDVSFANVKNVPGVKAGSTIKVIYASILNKDANIGSKGNKNEMQMEYSNNSYNEGEGTGRTPWDTVIVFTYQQETQKVDGLNQPLEGAGFTLYKAVKEAGVPAEDYETDTDGTIWHKVDEIAPATGVTTFSFKGIDDGLYKLVETTVPAGYNKADDIYFEVTAVHYNDEDGNDALNLGSLRVFDKDGNPIDADTETGAFKVSMEDGKLSTTVINNNGLELPSTGGIGTTIFYVVGAILVAGAVILLVTKKRTGDATK